MSVDADQITRNPERLVAGKWYACGFFDDSSNAQIAWDRAEIYKYEGDGLWTDEAGEQVEALWDLLLQENVAMDAADAYAEQT